MTWSLYENDKFLEPLKFSNGKTQEDIVKEVLTAIKEGKNVIFIHGICGTGKCLGKDSLIFCKPDKEEYFSYYKISELVEKGGKIMCLNESGKIVESEFCNVRKTGRKKLYKLKTRTGREIIASKNHPFLTITKEGVRWLPLEKLNESSYICLSNKINLGKSTNINDNEIKVLAHLIAEGKLGDKTGSPKYYQCPNQNPKIREDYINSLKNLFPDGEIKERDNEVTIKFGLMNTTKGTTNKLRLFIRKYGLDEKKSNNKFVPKEIFGLEKEKVALFLSRLFSCDGSIYKRNIGQIIIEYSSISKRLIQDVSILLQRFGIQHTITSKKFRDNKNYSFRISISESRNLKRYIEGIGFIGRKNILAKKLLKRLKDHKFTNIDKIPRIIREYLKSLGYSYLELDRFLNYEEITEERENKNFKEIKKDKLIKTPYVFNQQGIDFLREHLIKINAYLKNSTLSFICSENIFWDKIKSIEYLKEDETYDLEVPKYHNFIADGIIAHNSAIALNIARNLGKTSIIVPGKNLQTQYQKDYESKKYLLKKSNLENLDTSKFPQLQKLTDNKEKLKIRVMTGRRNHKCKFLEDNKNAVPKIMKEVNAKLNDIFAGKKRKIDNLIRKDLSADNKNIPCKIEIKEKNWNRIKEYLRQNKRVEVRNFLDLKDVKRISVAGACPYWCPILPEKYELKQFENAKKREYIGLNNTKFVFYARNPCCDFYNQFNSYIDADVIVFNSLKYKLESALNRKPQTEAEIIDECDEFLDSFSNQRTINIERLQNSLSHVFGFKQEDEDRIREIEEITKQIKRNDRINDAVSSGAIIPIKETGIYDLFRIFLDSPEFLEEIDEESYLFEIEETARMFEEFFDESYLSVSKREDSLVVSIVTTNLAKRFQEMVDKNKIIVLMSGTLHSPEVLEGVFGLKDYKVIEAETEQQGRIKVQRTGKEMDCKYANFSQGRFRRKDYLVAFSKCIEIAKKPVLVHVNAFVDLPSEQELEEFGIDNLISREKLRTIQDEDKIGFLVERFKTGQSGVLFTTRCGRGIDFPGEQCNSIVFTKYPNPNVQDAFWKILHKTKPQFYWSFYKDKARRELWQKIYRGLRFKEDHIYLLSPDSRVLDVFSNP